MKVVCVATEKKGYYHQLEQSCSRYQVPFVPLLLGKKWNGYGDKIVAIHEYLQDEDASTYLLFVDAYDTLLISDPESLIHKYERLDPSKSKIWIATETSRGINYWASRLVMGECNGHLLNSGTYFAQAGTILQMTTALIPLMQQTVVPDDQKLITRLCQQQNAQKPLFMMDSGTQRQLAQVCDDERSRRTLIETVQIDMNNTALPAVAHFTYNGDMEPLIDALGYNLDNAIKETTEKRDGFGYYKKLAWHHMKSMYYDGCFAGDPFVLLLLLILILLITTLSIFGTRQIYKQIYRKKPI
jgi:hypothetical protein